MPTAPRILLILALLISPVAWSEPAEDYGAPRAQVELWGMTIATLRVPYEMYTPAQRAETAAQHIQAIPLAGKYNIELRPGSEGKYKGAWVMVNQDRVFALLEGDVPGDLSFDQYGAQVATHLQEWLQRRQTQLKPQVLFTGGWHSALATLIYILAIVLVLRSRNFLHTRIENLNSMKSARKRLQLGGIFLLPYILTFINGLLRLLMLFTIALASYIWLTYVLRQFPYTKGTGERLTDYIINIVHQVGSALASAIPDLVMVAIIFWLARFGNSILKNIFARIEAGRIRSSLFDQETAKATRRVLVIMVWIFATIIAYPYIPGSQTEAFKGVSVFLGLMVSLGSAGMVSQVLGGLIVVYSRAFQPGEFIKIGEHEGTVLIVGVLSTKIRTLKQEEISIPNAVLLNASTVNFTRLCKPDGLIITTAVTIGYDTPWRQVHDLLLGAAAQCTSIRTDPAPRVMQTALSDWYVEYRIAVNIDEPARKMLVLSELHQQIQDAFAAAQVQIMSPHFVAQPTQPVLPAPTG